MHDEAGKISWKAGHRFGHDVPVFGGVQRHGQAVIARETRRPHAGGENDLSGGDHAGVRFHPGDAAVSRENPGRAGVLEDLRAVHPCAGGQRPCHVQRIHLPVRRNQEGAKHVRAVHPGPDSGNFVRRQQPAFDLHPLRVIMGAAQLLQANAGESQVHRAVRPVSCGLARFLLQSPEEVRGVAGQFRLRAAFPQLPDESGGVPGGARRDLLAFDEHPRNALRSKVIERRATDDAAADDRDGRGGGELHDRILCNCPASGFSVPQPGLHAGFGTQPRPVLPAWKTSAGPDRTGKRIFVPFADHVNAVARDGDGAGTATGRRKPAMREPGPVTTEGPGRSRSGEARQSRADAAPQRRHRARTRG